MTFKNTLTVILLFASLCATQKQLRLDFELSKTLIARTILKNMSEERSSRTFILKILKNQWKTWTFLFYKFTMIKIMILGKKKKKTTSISLQFRL